MKRKEMEVLLRQVLGREKSMAAEQAHLCRLYDKMRIIRQEQLSVVIPFEQQDLYQEQMEECYRKIQQHKAEIWKVRRMLFDILEEDERKMILFRCSERMNWTQIELRFPFGRSQCFRVYRRALEKLCEGWEQELQMEQMICQ